MSKVLPILFNTDMVRAILSGRKTVTRRVIKPQPKMILAFNLAGYGHEKWSYPPPKAYELWGEKYKLPDSVTKEDKNMLWTPPCHTDDILYVRETWFYENHMEKFTEGKPDLPSGRYSHRYVYRADNPHYPVNVGIGAEGWRPSIHMPKEAARIWLKVTDVRVERLQDITEEQALKEGASNEPLIEGGENFPALYDFVGIWNSTIKRPDLDRYGWEANPYVWAIEFERCERPED